MALNTTIAHLRQERNMTQEELAARVFVTRQAVSRWETGETTPSINMCKLLAVTFDVPISCLLEMPDYPQCQSCGMPLEPQDRGTEADGSTSPDFCKHCYSDGAYTQDASLQEMIEHCAPFMVQYAGMELEDAVSFLGAMLPNLKRWRAVQDNEREFGAEARARYGDEVIDAANKKLLEMDIKEFGGLQNLEQEILDLLAQIAPAGDVTSPDALRLCSMHAAWIKGHWPDGMYTPEMHLALAQGYLCDDRFIAYYDKAAGTGACTFLVKALEHFLQ